MTPPRQPADIGPSTPAVSAPTAPPADANRTSGDGSTGATTTPRSGPRYLLSEEIARGGMGAVYRAADTAFDREVAVKVLLEKFAPDSGTARRFHDEARITGQLQHPGIPPAFDLGELPDGRSFLAMKLIKGDTLDDLLGGRADPAAERGRLVAVFEKVCEAVAYAHAHDVIHRDLKPANMMVGAFGEVQVMDWGLAKVLASRDHQSPEADPNETTMAATEVRSLRDSEDLLTQAGSVLGTPAYMPPEQALGAVHEVDRRSDVFGLGGILACVLTGRPPFAGGTAEATRLLAARGQLHDCFARLESCGAEPGLIALCQRCLAVEKQDRPADAGEVAVAVAGLRQAAEERARQAELDRVRAEGERARAEAQTREQRRRRRVQLGLLAALFVLLAAGGAFAWWHGQRLARNAEAVSALLEQAEQALHAGDAERAEVALQAAGKRASEGGVVGLADRMQDLQRDLDLLRELDRVDRFRWTPVESKFPTPAAVAGQYRHALGRFGMDPDEEGASQAAERAAGSAVRQRVVTALDRLLQAQKSAEVREALRLLDGEPFRDEVREALLAGQTRRLAELAGKSEAQSQPPGFAAVLGELKAVGLQRRRQLLEMAVAERPGDLGLLMALAGTYPFNTQEGSEQRLRWCQAAVAVAPSSSAAHHNLGIVLYDRKELAAAEAEFRAAIRLHPSYAYAHNGLGLVLHDKKELAAAEAEYRTAIRLDPSLALPHNNLGNVLYDRKNLAAAEAEFRTAIRLDPSLAHPHNNLGNVLRVRKELVAAEAEFRTAIRLDPSYAMPHNNLGNVLYDRGELDGAIAAYKRALQIDPKHSYALVHLPQAQRMRDLLPRLPAVLAGKEKPKSPAEACDFADLCARPFQKRYAAAARLYEGAFAADAKLADDLAAWHRYNAACCAALAVRGEGVDAPADTAVRTALRAKAQAWLGADLTLYKKQAASAVARARPFAAAKLIHWLADSDLSGVREAKALAGLPAAEQEQWQRFWADVRSTLALARKPPPLPDRLPMPRVETR